MTNVAVIYLSATGNVHALAEGAAEAGAQVRRRRDQSSSSGAPRAGHRDGDGGCGPALSRRRKCHPQLDRGRL